MQSILKLSLWGHVFSPQQLFSTLILWVLRLERRSLLLVLLLCCYNSLLLYVVCLLISLSLSNNENTNTGIVRTL